MEFYQIHGDWSKMIVFFCGPKNGQRILKIELPRTREERIAVLISGGIDSALLYYLLLLENQKKGNIHNIIPVSIMRQEGSRYFSNLVIGFINSKFQLPHEDPLILGDNTLPEEEQVKSAVVEARNLGFETVYAGVIEQLPQHMVDWQPILSKETEHFKTPLSKFNKSHVIDLVAQLKLEYLFYITHSCSSPKYQIGRCNKCNGCNERSWAFDQLGITDPGLI
jgi:7-cyano-7-deazaguanine synthase in queuosine biosynthesis